MKSFNQAKLTNNIYFLVLSYIFLICERNKSTTDKTVIIKRANLPYTMNIFKTFLLKTNYKKRSYKK